MHDRADYNRTVTDLPVIMRPDPIDFPVCDLSDEAPDRHACDELRKRVTEARDGS
jgi:hypothetical protein